MPRILLTQAIHPDAQSRLASIGEVVIAPNQSQATLRSCAIGCDVVIVRAQLPDDIFSSAPSLFGAVRHGAGVDMIPLAQATAHGILVANVPGVNANAVAEHVLRSALQLARQSQAMTLRLRERSAGWSAARAYADSGIELAGRTLGLIGFGHLGRAIARISSTGFSMNVLVHTRSAIAQGESPAKWTKLPEVLSQSDFLVLACPLTDETRGLIGAGELALMKPGAFLINVARGAVVDDAALVTALSGGRLGGAALDVFSSIPLPDAHPLWQMENVLITPHVAGITQDSMLGIGHAAVTAVEHLLLGEVPPHCINPQAIAAFARRRPRAI